MLKFLISVLFLLNGTLGAAALPDYPRTVEDIIEPTIVLDRPGLYRIAISRDSVAAIRDELMSAFRTESDPVPNEVACFDEALSNLIYPHPSTITIDRKVWSKIRQAMYNLRKEYGLGVFDTGRYESPLACVKAFEAFVDAQPRGLELRLEIKEKVNHVFRESVDHLSRRLEEYKEIFAVRATSFRQLAMESYIRRLLNADAKKAIDEQTQRAIEILISRGLLELFGNITNRVFDYSPRLMVETYLAKNGTPSEIVLGCGHSNKTMMEDLGVPDDVWCGCCENLPHTGALVVSLHESSADIVCNLNHPDLWEPISDNSVDSIHDETWNISCYEPGTLNHIARVLKTGGQFTSNGYVLGTAMKGKLLERGFEVIEESPGSRMLRMRKTR